MQAILAHLSLRRRPGSQPHPSARFLTASPWRRQDYRGEGGGRHHDATRRIVATWPIPGGGSPDMRNVSVDGKTLWLSGRYSLGHTGNMR